MGELLFGAERSGRPQENRTRVEAFARDLPLLSCDSGTAVSYAVLKDDLQKKGRPIPDNDLWIAATAHQHQLTLVARDKHFHELGALDQNSW